MGMALNTLYRADILDVRTALEGALCLAYITTP